MKPAARTGEGCLAWYGAFRAEAAPARHTFHAAGTPGSSCIDCHMSKTVRGCSIPRPIMRSTFRTRGIAASWAFPMPARRVIREDASWSIAQISKRFSRGTRLRRRQRLALTQSPRVKEDPRAEEAFTGILRGRSRGSASPRQRSHRARQRRPDGQPPPTRPPSHASWTSLIAARALGTRREKSAGAARAPHRLRETSSRCRRRSRSSTSPIPARPSYRGAPRTAGSPRHRKPETALAIAAGRGDPLDAALAHLFLAIAQGRELPDHRARVPRSPAARARAGHPEPSHRGERAAG